MTHSAQSAITHQIMWNRLLALVEEQGQVLIRTAFSPIVRECGDISAGIFDAQGRMLAQAVTGTPGHINTMAEAVVNMLEYYPIDVMKPGDVFVTNDPWLASGHLNDFLLIQPAFLKGQVVGLTACTSHLMDLGGQGMGPEGTDVYDEGLLIPPCRIAEEGKVNDLLLSIIKANGRDPILNEGDLYALMSCCDVGVNRLVEMMEEFGQTDLDDLGAYILETSKRGAIEAISNVPNGVYDHQIKIDGYDFEIILKARMTITDDQVHLDLTGSSGPSAKGINCTLAYASAYAVFGIRCLIGPDIPNNAGSLEPFIVTAPKGSIVNAQHPAPVAMRHTVGQMLPDLVFGCLSQALPDAVPAEGASCLYDLPMRNAPALSPDAHVTEFAVELSHNGGTGARPNKDGLSATAYPSGVWGSQVEMTEATAPLIVKKRELRTDSGGAGLHQGGLGQVIEIQSSESADIQLFLSVERVKNPAAGTQKGQAGTAGHIAFQSGQILPSKGAFRLAADDTLIFQTPGGGGFGDPLERPLEQVHSDFEKGLISEDHALNAYGLVLGQDGTVDEQASGIMRHNMREART